MSLSLKERKAVVRETSKRYKRARKKDKGKILDEFVKLTGYNRCYASYFPKSAFSNYKSTVKPYFSLCFFKQHVKTIWSL